MKINIRPFKPSDLKGVMKVEKASFPSPWEEKDFQRAMKDHKNVGMVAEVQDEIVGYLIYRLEKDECTITSIAVLPQLRRKGIGKALFNKLLLMSSKPHRSIELTASDANLEAHLFFKHLNFKATAVLHNFYDSGDGYCFVYQGELPAIHRKKEKVLV